MTARQPGVSELGRGLSSEEGWQDLFSFTDVEGEQLYDPLFQGVSAADPNILSGQQNDSFNQLFPSAPASVVDDPFSFDYTVSGPPSVVDGQPSANQGFSWWSGSPSFSTNATSPVVGRHDNAYHSSFSAFDDRPFSQRHISNSPRLDVGEQFFTHSFGSNNSLHTPFNHFLPGTSNENAFDSLDVRSSRLLRLSNIGGWADQQQPIDPILESNHEGAIPIPQQSSAHGHSYTPVLNPTEEQDQDFSRAITIPQSHRRANPYASNMYSSPWSQQVPPILPSSPEGSRRQRSTVMSRSTSNTQARRTANPYGPNIYLSPRSQQVPPILPSSPEVTMRHRSAVMSRSSSNVGPRRGRNSLTTPSPTSQSLGWVSYRPDQNSNGLVASATEGSIGKRHRGRTRGLTATQRQNAAMMRIIGACSNCQKRKEKCDEGTPCKSCLDHYKEDLVNHPCGGRRLTLEHD